MPIVLEGVRIAPIDGAWLAIDRVGDAVPLAFLDDDVRLHVLAHTGPHRVTMFGEWEAGRLWPITVATTEGLVRL